jgi:hypothetical protein
MIDLTLPSAGFSAAYKPISNLAVHRLQQIHDKIDDLLDSPDNLDEYSLAHLTEARTRISKALEAEYIYNTDALGGGSRGTTIFFQPSEEKK